MRDFEQIVAERFKSIFKESKGYAISLSAHPLFGILDVVTTKMSMDLGERELNPFPRFMFENTGFESWVLLRLGMGIAVPLMLESGRISYSPRSYRDKLFWSNIYNIPNVLMAVNNVASFAILQNR